MSNSTKLHAFSLASTSSVAYVFCAIFDALFPPYGFLVKLSSAAPFPIYGGLIGYLTGFLMFSVAGLLLGGLYGIFWTFWNKKL